MTMRIQLSAARRASLVRSLQGYFEEHFDEPLSEFRAAALVDFLIEQLGPPAYNQGVRDAHAFVLQKLADLEGEVYEREPPA